MFPVRVISPTLSTASPALRPNLASPVGKLAPPVSPAIIASDANIRVVNSAPDPTLSKVYILKPRFF